MQAQDVMMTHVATIGPDATVQEAARLMLERRVSALPVVDRRGRVVGMVSEGDLMRRTELGTDDGRSWWLRAIGSMSARDYVKTHAASVGDVMSSPPISVRRSATLQKIVELFEKHRIKRVPVVEEGRLLGIVSRADLVRSLAGARAEPSTPARAHRDRALRLEVLKQVRGAGLDLTWLNITVEHGIVHLWGAARSRMDQKAVRMAARGVDGVREVHDHSSVLPLKVAAALGTM